MNNSQCRAVRALHKIGRPASAKDLEGIETFAYTQELYNALFALTKNTASPVSREKPNGEAYVYSLKPGVDISEYLAGADKPQKEEKAAPRAPTPPAENRGVMAATLPPPVAQYEALQTERMTCACGGRKMYEHALKCPACYTEEQNEAKDRARQEQPVDEVVIRRKPDPALLAVERQPDAAPVRAERKQGAALGTGIDPLLAELMKKLPRDGEKIPQQRLTDLKVLFALTLDLVYGA
jgi:hypothetical protein